MQYLLAIIIGLLFYFGKFFISFYTFNIPVFYIEILVVILTIIYFITSRGKISFDKYSLILYLLLLLHIITILKTDNPIRALEGVKTYFFVILIYFSIKKLLDNLWIEKSLNFIRIFEITFFSITFVKIINIIITNNLINVTSIYLYKSNFVFPFGESNYVAQIMLFFTVIFFIDLIKSKKAIFAVLFSLGVFSLIILNSRSALLSFSIVMVFYFLKNLKKLRFNYKTIFLLGIVSLLLVYIGKNTVFFSLIMERFSTESSNIFYRINHYSDIVNVILNGGIISFLIGNGMGTETDILDSLLIHNLILKLIFSIGIIGLIIYITFFIFICRDIVSLAKKENRVEKYLYAIASLFLSSLVEPVLYTSYIEYFLTVYVAFVTIINKKTNSNKVLKR